MASEKAKGRFRGMNRDYRITLMDALCFLHNLESFPASEGMDTTRTATELKQVLATQYTYIDRKTLESLLYFCNLNEETRRYSHPQGKSLQTILKFILPPGEEFDRRYNRIKLSE